jgi:hypothetical protein
VNNRRGLQASMYDGVVISNGLIKLGVTRSGALDVDVPGNPHYRVVGLQYIFTDLSKSNSTSYDVIAKDGAPERMEPPSCST